MATKKAAKKAAARTKPVTRAPAQHASSEQLVVPGLDAPTNMLWHRPEASTACFVLAHGAGTGMRHAFLDAFADALHTRHIATLRFDFPYRAAGRKLPDRPKVLEDTVAAALAEAKKRAPELPLFVGGKSMGGRMSAYWLARSPDTAVRGLIFLGFPLHPPRKPSDARANPLFQVAQPMLFLQGSRDALADPDLLQGVHKRLGAQAELHVLENADHSFAIPKRQPPPPGGMIDHLAALSVTFMAAHAIGAAARKGRGST